MAKNFNYLESYYHEIRPLIPLYPQTIQVVFAQCSFFFQKEEEEEEEEKKKKADFPDSLLNVFCQSLWSCKSPNQDTLARTPQDMVGQFNSKTSLRLLFTSCTATTAANSHQLNRSLFITEDRLMNIPIP